MPGTGRPSGPAARPCRRSRNTSGQSGTGSSGVTMIRPARSCFASSHLRGRRGDHAGGPDHGARRDPLVAHRSRRRRRSAAPAAPSRTSTPQPLELRAAPWPTGRAGTGPAPAAPPSTRITRASMGSMARKSAASAWLASSATAPAISTPVGPPPTTTKVSSRWRSIGIVGDLGALEGQQHALADMRRVGDLLQAGCGRLPLVHAEIGMAGAGGEHEIVEADPAILQDHLAAVAVDARPPCPSAPTRSSAGRGSSGSARRCRPATGPRSPPGRAAAGTGGSCGGRSP